MNIMSEEKNSSEAELPKIESIVDLVSEETDSGNSRISFEEFTDERILISYDCTGNKQMKIKVLEVSDEKNPSSWKFEDRVKINKILITIKHLTNQEVEEAEFDIEEIERELQERSHYSSTNRWVDTNDIKNGFVVASYHTRLISDAHCLDYIVF